MKKVLLASTMLVATGGMAAADITFNGFGRFGLKYLENDINDVEEHQIEQRFRLNIVGTAETDGGVKFGARMRIESNDISSDADPNTDDDDDNAGSASDSAVRAPEFNVQAGGFRLDVGNTSDVVDSGDVVNYYGYGVGLTSFLEQSSGFFLPASGISGSSEVAPTIKARYTFDAFTVAASYTDNADDDTREEWQIGFGYVFGDYSAGIAFGNEDDNAGLDNDFWAASFSGMVSSVGFSIVVADSDNQDDTSWGISISVPVGASTSIQAVVADGGDWDGDGVAADAVDQDTAYGIGFRHSLGGGVSLRGGIASNADDKTEADLGVIFDF